MKKDTLTEMEKKRKENEREEKIKKERGCKFIWINPDAENYDIFVEIGKIQVYIAQSNKEKLEKEKQAGIKELKKIRKRKGNWNKRTKRKIRKRKRNRIRVKKQK